MYVKKTGDKKRHPVIAIAALTAVAISGVSAILGTVNYVEIQNVKTKIEEFLEELDAEIYNSLKQIEGKLNFKIKESKLDNAYTIIDTALNELWSIFEKTASAL